VICNDSPDSDIAKRQLAKYVSDSCQKASSPEVAVKVLSEDLGSVVRSRESRHESGILPKVLAVGTALAMYALAQVGMYQFQSAMLTNMELAGKDAAEYNASRKVEMADTIDHIFMPGVIMACEDYLER
jgi:archaellum biogenesis protein FlaJ (TadC family)